MIKFFQLLRIVFPYKNLVFWYIFFSLFTVLFSLISIIMLVPFLELLFDKTQLIVKQPTFALNKDYFIDYFYYFLSKQIILTGKKSALVFFCIIVFIVFLLKNLFRYLALYILAPLRNRIIFDLRKKLFIKILSINSTKIKESSKGEIITRFTSDMSEIEYSIMNTLEASIQSPITIFVFLGSMLFISSKLTIFVFVMIIFMALTVGRVGKSLKKQSSKGKEIIEELTSFISESLNGHKIISIYNIQNWIFSKFNVRNTIYYNTFNKMYRKRDLASPITEFMAIGIVCIVLYYGGGLVLNKDQNLNASNFIAFMVIFSQLISPAKSFSNAYIEIQKGMASIDRINTILNQHSEFNIEKTSTGKIDFKDKIVMENINFGYDLDKIILKNINLIFEKGKSYALVGKSGGGKSTIIDLILGFHTNYKGNITIDNKNLLEIDKYKYRNLFSIITQDPVLFDLSINENIALEDDFIEEKLTSSLKHSNSFEFVSKLSEKNYNNIGENGNKLSGGEKQRLNLARVIYSDRDIIIFDEATSSIDIKNEKQIIDSFEKLSKNKTSIIIAHRLSTIKNVDKIYVIDNGTIVESGSHNELILNNGLYNEMIKLQSLS